MGEAAPLLVEGTLQDMQRKVHAKTDQARDAAQRESIECGAERGKEAEGEYEAQERRQDAINQYSPTPERPDDKHADAGNSEGDADHHVAADDALALGSEVVAAGGLDHQPLESGLDTEGGAGLLDQGHRGFGTGHVVDGPSSGDFHEQGSAVRRQKVW